MSGIGYPVYDSLRRTQDVMTMRMVVSLISDPVRNEIYRETIIHFFWGRYQDPVRRELILDHGTAI